MIAAKLDDLCRQAQELQKRLRKEMVERARRNQPARTAAPTVERRKSKRAK